MGNIVREAPLGSLLIAFYWVLPQRVLAEVQLAD